MSARIRILMDVKKPLRRVQRVSVKQGSSTLIEVKYESLPTICYGCGLIGHIERDCSVQQVEDDRVEKQWGAWLRASPRKGRLRLEEETRRFLKQARSLRFDEPAVVSKEQTAQLERHNLTAVTSPTSLEQEQGDLVEHESCMEEGYDRRGPKLLPMKICHPMSQVIYLSLVFLLLLLSQRGWVKANL
ncbi:hypothetical protein BVRB_5g107190 [Beta vulgaris subsp. vulgaris]|nr:hypothetical protein BVRB_5g107190 [Beta vulgaris subsp. vulgaris]